MNSNLTLGQRFMAEEPDLFKLVKFLAFVALLVAASLQALNIGSESLRQALTTGGSVAYIIAGFTVKDVNALIAAGFTPESVMKVLTDLPGQIAAVKAQPATPVTISGGIIDFPETPVDLPQSTKPEAVIKNISDALSNIPLKSGPDANSPAI